MGEKLEENSRRMLPEYKGRMILEERETACRVKPVLEEQKLGEIQDALARSLRSHVRVTVVLFEPEADRICSGFVTSIHAHSRELKLQWAGDSEWIRVDDIMEVRLS